MAMSRDAAAAADELYAAYAQETEGQMHQVTAPAGAAPTGRSAHSLGGGDDAVCQGP